MLRLFLLSFAVSLAVGYLTLRWEHLHAHVTGDLATRGSHKIHHRSVSRIGGIAIFMGWLASMLASVYYDKIAPEVGVLWVACLLPVFMGGLIEDCTKRAPRMSRLLASFVSAGLAYVFLGAAITRTDIPGVDQMLTLGAASFLFTCFAIGGIAHAINIIDGLNGLASGVCLIALLALAYVAFQVADWQIIMLSGLGLGAILGFRVWNYPSGRIFCGDGGAYFLGAYVAVLSVLIVQRHPEVSPWFPVLIVLYPIWETLFSAYRRRVLRGRPASGADRLHMHTLVYKRVKHPLQSGKARSRRNSDASMGMVLFAGGSAVPAVLWWSDTAYLMAAALAYVALYIVIYRRLVRFRSATRPRPGHSAVGYVTRRVAALQRAAASRKIVKAGKAR